MKQHPSIFNDVLGPVMRGNSSSHTAASVRIGRLARQLAGGLVQSIAVTYDIRSSLAACHHTQYVDSALLAGLLGYDTSAREVCHELELAAAAGIEYCFTVTDVGEGHPNTYYIVLQPEKGDQIDFTALSTGGGMVQLSHYQGFPLLIEGGFHEVLLSCCTEELPQRLRQLEDSISIAYTLKSQSQGGRHLLQLQSEVAFPREILCSLGGDYAALEPVYPVVSQLRPRVPFSTASELLTYAKENPQLELWQLGMLYESQRSGEGESQVYQRAAQLLHTLRHSWQNSQHELETARILPPQGHLSLQQKQLLGGQHQRLLLSYITGIMDVKASLGVIVAAPTAGACACLPGTLLALGEEQGIEDDRLIEALLAAGMVGVLIAAVSTFAAEEAGCQAECGVASVMTAAACAQLLGATPETCLAAASMAMQGVFGLTCDPVAMRVEVPCLGKNILAAQNAIACANMAYSGYDQVIPFDETLAAFDAVGRSLPRELRCTGLGGLSQTPTSKAIARRFANETID